MVWSPDVVAVQFRHIPQRHCFYTLNTLLARYTEVNATLNNLFLHNELVIENENVLRNGVFRLTMSA